MNNLNIKRKLNRIITENFAKFFSTEVIYLSLSNEDYGENIKDEILVGGIDEAGRGPVIGPMVMAAVKFPARILAKVLTKEFPDIKESKELSPHERYKIADFLWKLRIIRAYLAIIPPAVIDFWVMNKSLNDLEANVAITLLKKFLYECFVVYIDSPSTSESFLNYISKYKDWNGPPHVIAEVKADKPRIPVAMASIFAKIMRDSIIKEVKIKIGMDVGSGYPSDPKTRKALPYLMKRYQWIIRKSWKTVQRNNS